MKKPQLQELTLREKIGQTVCVRENTLTKVTNPFEHLKKYPYGCIWAMGNQINDTENMSEETNKNGKATGKGLHRATVELVRAPAQAAAAEKILPLLTEEEQAVFRRGRNANVHSIPQNASRAQYQQATALESLIGWLYLRGERSRIEELFCVMMGE